MRDLTGAIAIIGAGHAGVSAAAFRRQNGWTGRIQLISDENRLPYNRPPLSKGWLKNEVDEAGMALRPEQFYAKQDANVRLRTKAERIDPAAGRVRLSDGSLLDYAHLIIATGARPRRLAIPGVALEGVLELRCAADADRLKMVLRPGAVVAIVGGGYIGLEIAATAMALGAKPIVIEREDRVLARVASRVLSGFLEHHHLANGVQLELSATVTAFEGADGRVTAVLLANGRRVACDVVLVGVGAVPNDEIARRAGLACDNGIVVDAEGRTSHERIYAIGDCAVRPLRSSGGPGRLESVPSAVVHARQTAAFLCGRPAPKSEVPWFWSDQFDLRLQLAGVLDGVSETVVRSNSPTSISIFHLTADRRMRAVEAVNRATDFMAGKVWISRGQPISLERLQDQAVPMNDIAA